MNIIHRERTLNFVFSHKSIRMNSYVYVVKKTPLDSGLDRYINLNKEDSLNEKNQRQHSHSETTTERKYHEMIY